MPPTDDTQAAGIEKLRDLRASFPDDLVARLESDADLRESVRRVMAWLTPESIRAVGFTAEELAAVGPISESDRQAMRAPKPRVPDDEAMEALKARHAQAQAENAASADELELAKAGAELAREEMKTAVRRAFQDWRRAGRPATKAVLGQLRDALVDCEQLGGGRPVELTAVERRLLGLPRE